MGTLTMKLPALLIVAALVFSFSFPVHAQDATTTPDTSSLAEQIAELLQLVTSLQEQLAELTRQQNVLREDIREAVQLTRTLARGTTGDDVEELQELLASDPEIYPEGLVTGYFGPLTEAAVERLQERFGIEQVGIVGPITRGTINKLFGNLNRGKGSLNRGPGNVFDMVFAEDEDQEDNDIDFSQFVPGTKGVFVCHIPPGNPAAAHTIAVGGPAVQAHINHGDVLGRCGDESSDEDEDEDGEDTSDEDNAQAALDSASDAIQEADEAIDAAQADGRDTDDAEALLQDARDKLDEAQDAFDNENFDDAESLAEEAEALAEDAEDAIGAADTTAPVISSVAATAIASTTATITWNTDEDADSMVTYSTDSSVETDTSSESDSADVMNHSLDLTGLETDTEYFYFVESEDPSGNTASSSIQSFTTSS